MTVLTRSRVHVPPSEKTTAPRFRLRKPPVGLVIPTFLFLLWLVGWLLAQ